MSQRRVNETSLTATADALREKLGISDPITWIEDKGFADAVAAIEDLTITDASYLFYCNARLADASQYIPRIKGVTSTAYMFYHNTDSPYDIQEYCDLAQLDMSQVSNADYMFFRQGETDFSGVANWDVSALSTARNMFAYVVKDFSLFANWNVEKLYDTEWMFGYNDATRLEGLENWNTISLVRMASMFRYSENLLDVSAISNWDVSNVTTMESLFANCPVLQTVDFSSWNMAKVTAMSGIFSGCEALESILGFSAPNKAGITIGFPYGTSSAPMALKRLVFRTDLDEGEYAIRSSINIKYCSFEREGMVEMFNTLTDISALGLSSSYTKITITGNPCVTDGTLTDDDRAIATGKGWTLIEA